jgi:hypothetical protein
MNDSTGVPLLELAQHDRLVAYIGPIVRQLPGRRKLSEQHMAMVTLAAIALWL